LCWAAATIPAAVTAAAAAVLAAVAAPISPAVATIIAAVATTAVAVGGPRGAALRERWPGVLSYRNAQATISHLLVVAARDRGLRLLLRGVADKSEAARLAGIPVSWQVAVSDLPVFICMQMTRGMRQAISRRGIGPTSPAIWLHRAI